MSRTEFEALVRAFQASPAGSEDARALWSLIERELHPPVSPAAPPTLSEVLDPA